MHDRTRRRLMRLAFVALCLAPALAIFAWAVARALPGYVDRYERTLARRLGVAVQLADVTHPRPGVTRLTGVTLSDAETGVVLAHAPRVSWQRRDGRWQIEAPQVDLHPSGAARWPHWLRDQVTQFPTAAEPVQCRLGHVRWTTASRQRPLHDIEAKIAADGSTVEAQLQWTVGAERTPIQLRLTRTRRPPPARDHWHLDTGETAVPCVELAMFVPAVRHLGADATWQGVVQAGKSTDGWQGHLSGTARQVDLHALVGQTCGQTLRGVADVRVDRGRFAGSRLDELAGTATAGDGTIGQPLLNSTSAWLRLPIRAEHRGAGDAEIPFTQLAVAFHLVPAGLTLTGRCGEPPYPSLLLAADGPLLGQPPQHPHPPAHLARALLPPPTASSPNAAGPAGLLALMPVNDSESADRMADHPAHTDATHQR